jgi:hypothetical protein
VAESLDDLINAIQYAVIEAQQVAEDHHIDLVSRFFEEDDDGKTKAVTQEVWIPDVRPNAAEGALMKIDVPLMSLASLGAMKIKELKVEFTARLSSLDTEDDKDDAPPPPVRRPDHDGKGDKGGKAKPFAKRLRGKRKRMAFDFKKGADATAGESTVAKISITFEGTDPPEGVVRLNDQVLKTIP